MMKSHSLLAGINVLVLAFLVLMVTCNQPAEKPEPDETLMSAAPALPTGEDLVKRGEYLVNVGLCNDCHSPKIFTEQGPEPDPARILSGNPGDMPFEDFDSSALMGGRVLMNEHFTAFAGPWGVSYSANLTPDASGIGSWTEENFRTAMREGKYKGLSHNRNLLPPMPWMYFAKMTDEDLSAIFAYLKSIQPVQNVVPAPRTFAVDAAG